MFFSFFLFFFLLLLVPPLTSASFAFCDKAEAALAYVTGLIAIRIQKKVIVFRFFFLLLVPPLPPAAFVLVAKPKPPRPMGLVRLHFGLKKNDVLCFVF